MEATTSYPLRTSSDNTPPPTLTLKEALTRIQEVFRVNIQEGMTLEEQQEACFSAAFRASKEGEWQQIDQVKEALTILTDKLGRTVLQRAIDECETEIAHHLIDNQIALHPKNLDGDTALHRAARQGDIELIAKLYKHNYINAQNHKGQTPLHVAILSGQYEVVAALLLNGANLNSSFQWETLEVSPLALATLRGEIKCLEQLFKHKEVNAQEITHSIGNLLHVAVHFSQLSVIEYLFRHHVDRVKPLLEEKDGQGRSPLCLATVLDDPATVIFLHARGSNIESIDNQGRRPLHYAATALNQNLVELLYYLGANLSAADHTKRQNRPLDLVERMDKSTERSSTKKLFANLMERVKGEEHAPPQFAQRPPKNIVFKGGGPKGIAYVGAIRILEKKGLLNEVERYGGASAGAITAVLLAVGYGTEEMYTLLAETDLFSFLDFPLSSKQKIKEAITDNLSISSTVKVLKNVVHACSNPLGFAASTAIGAFKTLWHTTGLCEGKVFRDWIEERIVKKTEISDCTFKELREKIDQGKPFKHLHIVATKLGDSPEIAHLNSEDSRWDDVVISSAVGASMSIPGVFKPCQLRVKKEGKVSISLDLGAYLDGGMLNNLPVEIFDEKKYQMHGLPEDEKCCPLHNKRTLGFSLYTKSTMQPEAPKSSETIGDLLKEVVGVYYHAEDLIRQQNPYNKHRVIEIDNCGVSLLDFKIKKDKQDELIQSGESATHQFIEKQGNVQKSLFHYPRLAMEAQGLISLKAPHPHFVGRKQLLGLLEETLVPKEWKSNQATVIQALYGPGGIGKSETALTFANNHLDDYSLVWWIDAETKDGQERSYRELAQALRLDTEKDSSEAICGKVHTCLSQRNFEKPWLLIYDNVEESVKTPERGGVVLVTTRNKNLFPQLQRIEVKPFGHEDAIALFEKITNEEKSEEMEELVENLGDYPLVLTQVASYIAETPGMNLKKYLEKRQERSSSSRLQPDARYPKTLAETLGTTLELLQDKDRRAVRWLEMCAYLSSDGIDLSYLHHWLKEICKEGDVVERERHGEEILKLLTNYSLLRFDEETESLSIHRSIQEALRDRKDEIDQRQVFQEVFSCLLEKGYELDFDETLDWQMTAKQAKQWGLHALAFMDSPFFAGTDQLDQAYLFFNMGKIKFAFWDYQEALKLHWQALEIQKKEHGENHPDVAATLINMGGSLSDLGRNEEALKYCHEALEIYKEKLGERHPDVAATLINMGGSLSDLGRNEEALEHYRQALEIYKETLGENHPRVAMTLNDMGISLRGLGRKEEALERYRKALEIRKEKLGEKHPEVADTLTNMGNSLSGLDRKEEALELYREALEIYKEKFGENHPKIATTLNNMGASLRGLGRNEEALEHYRQALEIRKEKLGEKHPKVATALYNMGASLRGLGRKEEALEHYRQALEIQKEKLGEKHSHVADTLNNMGIRQCTQKIFLCIFFF